MPVVVLRAARERPALAPRKTSSSAFTGRGSSISPAFAGGVSTTVRFWPFFGSSNRRVEAEYWRSTHTSSSRKSMSDHVRPYSSAGRIPTNAAIRTSARVVRATSPDQTSRAHPASRSTSARVRTSRFLRPWDPRSRSPANGLPSINPARRASENIARIPPTVHRCSPAHSRASSTVTSRSLRSPCAF
jgi:hypothetical protein